MIPGITAGLAVTGSDDPYWANVSALLHFDGTNGSTTFTDSGPLGLAFSANGNAQISTTNSKFGGGCLLLDGTNDYVSIGSTAAFGFGTAAWTAEAWIRPTSVSVEQAVLEFRPPGLSGQHGLLYVSSTGRLAYYNGTTVRGNSGAQLVADVWQFVQWTYDGTTMRAGLNGSEVWNATFTPDFGANRTLRIGINLADTSDFAGRIDEVRITKGVARTIELPTEAFS